MPTVLSSSLRHKNLRNFAKTIEDESVYFFASKPTPWLSGDLLPPSVFDTFTLEADAYDEMLYLKRLSVSNISNVIRLYRWQENRRYQEYDNAIDLSDLLTKRTITVSNTSTEYYPFYIITDNYKVYKCLNNNSGVLSTTQPTSTAISGADTYTALPDGYIWKYMYTLKPLDASEFLTTDWFPLRTLQEDDLSDNWDIIQAAVNGGVYNVKVTNSGTGYNSILPTAGDTTEAQDGFTYTKVSDTSVTITGQSVSTTSGTYAGSIFYTKDGNGSITQMSEITVYSYSGSTGTLTLASPITHVSSGYEGYISPKITFVGDGFNLKALCRMSNSSTLSKVHIFDPGFGYSECVGTISAFTGTTAAVRVIITPFGGHGKDPVVELGAFNLLTKIKFEGDEGGVILATNEYRRLGILNNPLINGSLKLAQGRESLTTNFQIKLNAVDTVAAVGKKIYINSGTGNGQLRTCTVYDSGTKILTVSQAFDILPDNTSYYGFLATDAVINQCLVLNYTPGSKSSQVQYASDATITQALSLTPTATGTSGASTIVVSSATNIAVGQSVSGTGIGSGAKIVSFNGTTITLSVANTGTVSGAMSIQATASGTVVFDDTTLGKIFITNITGTFNTTLVSSSSVTVTPSSIQAGTPGVEKNSGNVLYLENRTPLSRYSEQIEDLRVIIQF